MRFVYRSLVCVPVGLDSSSGDCGTRRIKNQLSLFPKQILHSWEHAKLTLHPSVFASDRGDSEAFDDVNSHGKYPCYHVCVRHWNASGVLDLVSDVSEVDPPCQGHFSGVPSFVAPL